MRHVTKRRKNEGREILQLKHPIKFDPTRALSTTLWSRISRRDKGSQGFFVVIGGALRAIAGEVIPGELNAYQGNIRKHYIIDKLGMKSLIYMTSQSRKITNEFEWTLKFDENRQNSNRADFGRNLWSYPKLIRTVNLSQTKKFVPI